MSEQVNSVAGQLVGIPVGQVYTAGKGIKIDNVNKVVTVDETVLFEETNYTYGTTSVTLSEPYTNFEMLDIYTSKGDVQRFLTSNEHGDSLSTLQHSSKNFLWLIPWSFTNSVTLTGATGRLYELGTTNKYDVASNAQYNRWIQPVKIVGINRISGGN